MFPGYIKIVLLSVIAMSLFTSSIHASSIEEGKEIAFNRAKGNCLACHDIMGAQLTGNIAPPLIAMKARYPDREILKKQIWDASAHNPYTFMPPFGRHEILTLDEIEKVVDFIHSL
jgi:sulfur-oxidizing protein SoxX